MNLTERFLFLIVSLGPHDKARSEEKSFWNWNTVKGNIPLLHFVPYCQIVATSTAFTVFLYNLQSFRISKFSWKGGRPRFVSHLVGKPVAKHELTWRTVQFSRWRAMQNKTPRTVTNMYVIERYFKEQDFDSKLAAGQERKHCSLPETI